MKKPNLTEIVNSTKAILVKHSPEILVGIGVTGLLTTTVLAVKATPKALQLLEEERDRREEESENGAIDPLKPIEVVKVAWKPYVPAAVTAVVSTACIIGASSVNAKRNAALATAYTLSETALKEYKSKVVETIGEKKEQVVRDAIAKDKIEKDPVKSHEVIITEKGNTLCYDAISGRYFRSDIEKIRKAENELNRRMLDEMYISLNEWYYEIGLKPTNVGDELGWNIKDGLMDISFSSQLTEDGEPCLVVDYHIAPRYDFTKLM